jgi:hypothetical protein
MADDNVIRVQFGQGRTETQEQQQEDGAGELGQSWLLENATPIDFYTLSQADKKMILDAFMFYAGDKANGGEQVDAARNRLDEISRFLESLIGYVPRRDSVELRQEGIAQHGFADLVGHLLNSSHLDWQRQPSFYEAVGFEWTRRAQLMINCLDSI